MAGWYVLNTDASKPDPTGAAAIGAVLRRKMKPNAPMRVIAYISRVVGPVELHEAEYRALIEGLKLADQHEPEDLQVFVDPLYVAQQVSTSVPPKKTKMQDLHAEARQLVEKIGEQRIRISWLPRELNREADQRASDAFFKLADEGVWIGPDSSLIDA